MYIKMSCGSKSPVFEGPDYVADFNNYLAYVSTLRDNNSCCQGDLKTEVTRLNLCNPDYLVTQIKTNPENASAILQLANYCNTINPSKTIDTSTFSIKDACNVLMYVNPELLSTANSSLCDTASSDGRGFLQSGIPPSGVDINTCTINSCEWLSDTERSSDSCADTVNATVSFNGSLDPEEYATKICSNSFAGDNCVSVFTEALTNLQKSSRVCCSNKIPIEKNIVVQITLIVAALVLLALFIWLIAELFRKMSNKQ